MPGGRPDTGRQRSHAELAELAAWFRRALIEAGYGTVNAFVQRHPFEKNRVYGLFKGTRFLTLESTQAVAVALGRKSDDVQPLWWRAKAAMDRAAAAEGDGSKVRIGSWSELPWPHMALQDLLEAQSMAADTLPYHLLGIEPPPLSTVFVRQQLRADQAEKRDRQDPRGVLVDDPTRVADESSIPITAALDRHEHVLITGEPGAGKSTLAQFLALTLSRVWLRTETGEDAPLREPVIPLRVTARGLTGDVTWGSALAQAARQALGPMLVAEPSSSLFERRIRGVRWLVIVDGLDEIVDPAARASVIQALAARCRAGGDYRIAIMSRQLSEVDFAPLRGQHIATYNLEPFGRAELESFARCWFVAQETANPDEDSARFVGQIEAGGLGEIARNPLLATIAAIAYTLEPARPLPADRLGLYERFFEHLVLRDSSGRRTMAELRRLYADEPDRLRFITWLFRERVPLLKHLAVVRLDSERPVRDVARDWVRDHATDPTPGWEDDVERVLAGTGLLVFADGGVRFLHHSFAEYLAAQEYASRIGIDFPDLDAWINRAAKPAEREFAMFVFAMWSSRPGHDPGRVLTALLDGHPDHLLLAGSLLARVPAVSQQDNEKVVDRLVDLAVGAAVIDGLAGRQDLLYTALSATPMTEVVEVLSRLANNDYAATRLYTVADLAGIPLAARIAAVEALGKIDNPHRAVQALNRLLPVCRNSDLIVAIRCLHALAPDEALVASLLVELGNDPAASVDGRAEAAAELHAIGRGAEAVAIARATMLVRPVSADALRRVTATWLACVADPGERSEVIGSLLQQRLEPEQCIEMAVALAEAGLREEAGKLALRVLSSPDAGYWLLAGAAKQCAASTSMSAAELRASLPDDAAPASLARAAEGFAEAGQADVAIELARQVMANPAADAYDLGSAVRAWLLAAGPTAVSTIQQAVDQRLTNKPVEWAGYIAQQLADEGQPEVAVHVARLILRTHRAFEGSLWHATRAWLTAAGPGAAAEIREALESGPQLTPTALAMAAEGVALGGSAELALELAVDALARLGLDDYRVGSAIRAVVLARGPLAVEILRPALAKRPYSSKEWICVAEHLLACGALRAAREIWAELLAHPDTGLEHRALAAVRVVMSGGGATVREAIQAGPAVQHATALTGLIDALTALA